MINLPQGFQSMDSATKIQCLQIALEQELDAVQKQVLSLASSVASVAGEVERQKKQNEADLKELSQRIESNKVKVEVKPEIKVDTKGILANFLSLFNRK